MSYERFNREGFRKYVYYVSFRVNILNDDYFIDQLLMYRIDPPLRCCDLLHSWNVVASNSAGDESVQMVVGASCSKPSSARKPRAQMTANTKGTLLLVQHV